MSKRRCMRCGADFQKRMVGDVEVDACLSCGSVWLDAAELQELAEMPEQTLVGLRELVRRAPGAKAPPSRSEGQRLDSPCPACAGKLTSAAVSTVTVEVCCACGGVFLDSGELDKAAAEARGRTEKLATIAAMARSVSTRGTIGG